MSRIAEFTLGLAAALAALAGVHAAEGGAAPPTSLVESFTLRPWAPSRAEMFPSVRCVAQTQDGYLWAGSFDGLNRFDGTRSGSWPGDALAPGLGRGISALCPQGPGLLCVGTDRGLCRLEQGGNVTTWPAESLPRETVHSLVLDGAGRLHASIGTQVYQLEGGTWTPVSMPDGSATGPWRLVGDAAGQVYAWRPDGVYRKEDDGWRSVEQAVPPRALRGVARGRNAGIWIIDAWSAHLWVDGVRGPDRVRQPGFAGDMVTALEDREGRLWLGTYTQGLTVLGTNGPVWTATSRDELPNVSITALFEDADGHVWIGSNGGGLVQAQPRSFREYAQGEGLEQVVANSVAELEPGVMAVGTHGGGMQILRDGKFGTPVPFDSPPTRRWVHSVVRGAGNSLWLGTLESGLFHWSSGPAELRFSAAQLGSSSVDGMLADSKGRLWVGGNASLARVAGDELRVLGPGEGLNPAGGKIWGIQEGRDGLIWVLRDGGELIRSLDGDRFERVPMPDAPASFVPHRMFIDSRGDLWLGSNRGMLARWREGVIRWYGQEHGLPVRSVLSMVDDLQGGLWLGGDDAIGRIRIESADAMDAGRRATLESWRFDPSDGITVPHGRRQFFPTAIRASDGRVWFATMRGVAVTDPARIRPHRHVLAPVLESVGEPGSTELPVWGATVESRNLPPGTRRLRVRYTSPQLASPGRVRFQYRSGGEEAPWIDGPESREVELVNLEPGSHSMAVRCGLEGQAGWSAPAELRFDVGWQWWERPRVQWAAVLIGALVVGTGLWTALETRYRRRSARLARELELARLSKEKNAAETANKAKTEFIAMVSHELRTPLHGLLGYTDLLRDTPLTQTQSSYLATARQSAESLLRLINEVLDYSRLETGHLDLAIEPFSLRSQLRASLDLLATTILGKGLEFVCRVDPTVPDLLLGDAQRIHQVLVNLVGNAIKFTPSGHVHVFVEPAAGDSGRIEFRVSDTGIGISAEAIPRLFQRFSQADTSNTRRYGGTGLGLAISKGIVERMGGTITCSSEPGRGTTFQVTIPLQTAGTDLAVQVRPFPGFPWPVVDHALIGLGDATVAAVQSWIPASPKEGIVLRDLGAAESWLRQPGVGVAAPPTIFIGQVPGSPDPRFAIRALRQASRTGNLQLVLVASAAMSRPEIEAEAWDCDHVWRQPYVAPPEPVRRNARPQGFAGRTPRAQDRPAALGPDAARRVLLVEDHPVNQAYARDALLGLGCEVDLAGNGRDAIELARANRYDLILMDCQMPELDGWEATRQIRAGEAPDRHVRIVALTAGAYDGDRERCLEAGMDGFLSKPFRIDELQSLLTEPADPKRGGRTRPAVTGPSGDR